MYETTQLQSVLDFQQHFFVVLKIKMNDKPKKKKEEKIVKMVKHLKIDN